MATYYVIRSSDGDVRIEAMDKPTLVERLNEEYWGGDPVLLPKPGRSIDLTADGGLVIIAGEAIKPKE